MSCKQNIRIIQIPSSSQDGGPYDVVANTPNPGDYTVTDQTSGESFTIPAPVLSQITDGDGDTYVDLIESGANAGGGDSMQFFVDGLEVGRVEFLANGMTKWTLNGILDPIVYRPTGITTAVRDSDYTPIAINGDLIFNSDDNCHQWWDGATWKDFKEAGSVETWSAGVSFTSTNGVQVNPGNQYISFPNGTTWASGADQSGTVATATAAITTTNGVDIEIGDQYTLFPDGTTWASSDITCCVPDGAIEAITGAAGTFANGITYTAVKDNVQGMVFSSLGNGDIQTNGGLNFTLDLSSKSDVYMRPASDPAFANPQVWGYQLQPGQFPDRILTDGEITYTPGTVDAVLQLNTNVVVSGVTYNNELTTIPTSPGVASKDDWGVVQIKGATTVIWRDRNNGDMNFTVQPLKEEVICNIVDDLQEQIDGIAADTSGTVTAATVALTTTNGVDVAIGENYTLFPDGTTWASNGDLDQVVDVDSANNAPVLPLAADTTHAIIFSITELTAGSAVASGADVLSGNNDFSECEIGDQIQAVPTKIPVTTQTTVTQPDNAPNTVDWVISPNITLRRGNNGGFYNTTAGQTAWAAPGPANTLWRNDTETTPTSFQAAYDNAIGDNIADNPAYANAYVTDTVTGTEYGPFTFLSWQDGGGGGFSVLISETETLENGWSLNKIIQKPSVSCIAANTGNFSTTRTQGNGIELREEFRAAGVPQGQSMSSVINPGGQSNHYVGSWAIYDLDIPQKADSLTFSSFDDTGADPLELIVEVYNQDGNAVNTQTVSGTHGVDLIVTLPTVIDIAAVRVEVGAGTAVRYRSGDMRFGLNQPFFNVSTIDSTESVTHIVNNDPNLSAVLIGVQNKTSLQPLEAVALVRCDDGFYAQASPAQVQIIANRCESDILRSTGLGFDFTGNAQVFNTNTGAGITNNLFFDNTQLNGTATIELSAIPGINYLFSTDVAQFPTNQNINTATLRMTVYDSDGTTQLGTVAGNPQGSADDPISLSITPTGYSMLLVFEDESPTLANIYAQPPIIDGKFYLGEVQEVSVYENGNQRIVGYLKDGAPYDKSPGTTIEDCPEELLCLEDFECALDNITPSVQAKLNALTDNSPSRISKPIVVETSTGGIGAGEPAVATSGHLMYTQESVFTRFAAAQNIAGDNEPNFVGVHFDGANWRYSDNGQNGVGAPASWISFTPEPTDILFANVTFGNGPVGGSVVVGPFASAGITSGIVHVPNFGGFTSVQGNTFSNGSTNSGEFYVEGTFNTQSPNSEKATLQPDGTYKLDSDGSIITLQQAILENWSTCIDDDTFITKYESFVQDINLDNTQIDHTVLKNNTIPVGLGGELTMLNTAKQVIATNPALWSGTGAGTANITISSNFPMTITMGYASLGGGEFVTLITPGFELNLSGAGNYNATLNRLTNGNSGNIEQVIWRNVTEINFTHTYIGGASATDRIMSIEAAIPTDIACYNNQDFDSERVIAILPDKSRTDVTGQDPVTQYNLIAENQNILSDEQGQRLRYDDNGKILYDELFATGSTGLYRVGLDEPATPVDVNANNIITGFDLTQATGMTIEFHFRDTATGRIWQSGSLDVDTMIASFNAADTVHSFLNIFDNDFVNILIVDPATGEFTLTDTGRQMAYVKSELWAVGTSINPLFELTLGASVATTTAFQNLGPVDTRITGSDGDIVYLEYGDGTRDEFVFLDGSAIAKRRATTTVTHEFQVQTGTGQLEVRHIGAGSTIARVWYKKNQF